MIQQIGIRFTIQFATTQKEHVLSIGQARRGLNEKLFIKMREHCCAKIDMQFNYVRAIQFESIITILFTILFSLVLSKRQSSATFLLFIKSLVVITLFVTLYSPHKSYKAMYY